MPTKRTTSAESSKASVEAKSTGPQPGDAAPEFVLPDDGGQPVRLSQFRGKRVVLYFYPKDDTPGCTKEACAFRDGRAALAERNAVVLGVSADSVASHKKFKNKYALPFPLLSDEKKEAVKSYGVWHEKSMYGKKYMGIARTTFVIGPAGRIEKVFPSVKVDGHLDDILNSLPQ